MDICKTTGMYHNSNISGTRTLMTCGKFLTRQFNIMLFLFVYGDFCIIYQAFQLFAPETFYKNTVSVKASVFV